MIAFYILLLIILQILLYLDEVLLQSAAAENDFSVRPSLPPAFVSQTTLQALRITIKSTVDMVEFLLAMDEFDFVLTGKFNQDCLEVNYYFFFMKSCKLILFSIVPSILWNNSGVQWR